MILESQTLNSDDDDGDDDDDDMHSYIYISQVRLLPGKPVGPSRHSCTDSLQCHLRHNIHEARSYPALDVQAHSSLLQLAGEFL